MVKPSTPIACNASLTSSSLNGWMMASIFFMCLISEPLHVIHHRFTKQSRQQLIWLPRDLPPGRLPDQLLIGVRRQGNGDLAKVPLTPRWSRRDGRLAFVFHA